MPFASASFSQTRQPFSMARRVVVTGGGGFVGQSLARTLLRRGDDVWLCGLGQRPGAPAILSSSEWDQLRWVQCDMRSDAEVGAVMTAAVPDLIVHLAAISFIPAAELAPLDAYEVNVLGAVRAASSAARLRVAGRSDPLLLVIGSGTQYGQHPESEMPLSEDAAQRPVNAYAATKAAQEIAVLQMGRATGLRVICTRSFNHSGVGHDAGFLLPSLVKRVRELGSAGGELHIGNDVVRDYLHVDDVVDAYLALVDQGAPGDVYNVCSGVGVSVRDLAREVAARAGVTVSIVPDQGLQRSTDIPFLVGSPEKLARTTGWRPRKSHLDVIDDLLRAT
jgi:GDP-4-dehydro-6-deoxy-D-mannose reductase